MTAPFAAPPPRLFWFMLISLPVMIIATPFGRRDDWIGWIAFLVVAGLAIYIWAALLYGLACRFVEWYRDRSEDT